MGCGFNGRVLAAAVWWAFSFVASAPAPVIAQTAPGLALSGDAARGEKKFYTCYGCHGIDNYRNAYPNYEVPKLKGQHAAYLSAALREYQSGERPHATMHAQSASLSEQDIADITVYLQGAATKPTTAVNGSTPKQAETCAACHGVNGTGVDAPLEPKPPVLAGQHVDYLENALNSYRKGRRKNAVMMGMSQAIQSDADVIALAKYFSKQSSPLATAKK